MADINITTESTASDGVQVVTMSERLFGRRDIFASAEELTVDNVIYEVNTALEYHYANVMEEDYLYWYRRGLQPVLNRHKEYNDWILNKVCVNVASEIVDFKNGYFLMEPAFYTSRKAGKKTKVDKLNEYLYRSGKQQADNIIADWFHTVGKAALFVESSNEDPDIPLKAYAVDPRSAFVVKSMRPGNKPLYGVNVVTRDERSYIDVYTESTVFRLSGGAVATNVTAYPMYEATAINIDRIESNELGHIPIIEYRYNSVNQAAFENVITLIDAMSNIQSNRADGVEQFIQSLGVAINCNFDDTVTAETIKRSGLIALSSIGENKADFKILSEELNQDQTQTLVDNLYDQILRICSMPTTRKGGTSTSDTQGAVIFRDGWEQAAACARNCEDLFRESNRYFDAILIDVLREKNILDISSVDFELNFVRNETANVQSKAQAAQTMLAMGMAPELAFHKSGLSNDPVSDVKMSEKYLKMIWGDPTEAVKKEEEGVNAGDGEAVIIEEDNNNGENTAGGV